MFAKTFAVCPLDRLGGVMNQQSWYGTSLVPRPRGRRKDGLVSTARASAAISGIFP